VECQLMSTRDKEEMLYELKKIGVSEGALDILASKMDHVVIKVKGIRAGAANILKQEMLSLGGDVAVHRGCVNCSVEHTDAIVMGNIKQYKSLIDKLSLQPYLGLDHIARILKDILDARESKPVAIQTPRYRLPLGEKTYIMGILNVTPDSFSDGGKYWDIEKAVERAKIMVDEGADIIDVGGESTRPGYTPVSLEEEMRRVLPVVEKLVKEVRVPVSVDTTKAEVAKRALELGADIINDQWGLQKDEKMAEVVAEYDVPVVVMFNKEDRQYDDMVSEHLAFLRRSVELAVKAGLNREKVIIDPGIGFGKSPEQNLYIMKHLSEFRSLGLPILLGTSRKSMIGHVLDLPVDERVEGTAATVAYGITQGVDIVRVHDVKEMARVARMTDAMVRGDKVCR